MSLEKKSQQLKELIAGYNSDWLLGDLAALIHAGRERAGDQLGALSSPQRQLYYLAGLNISTEVSDNQDVMHNREKWNMIVTLLNEIEAEYDKLFFPSSLEEITDEWKRVRKVAMPSFLSYFNQGPLNYEEQVINWVKDLYTPLDKIVEETTGLKTEDFIEFYNNLDELRHKNFQAHSTTKELLRPNWKRYTKLQMGVPDEVPDFIKQIGEKDSHIFSYMADKGIVDRFYPEELTSGSLTIAKVEMILKLLSVERKKTDYLYYTETKPGNPLFETPIVNIGTGMYQVFEVKQVIHAIENLLEKSCTKKQEFLDKYIAQKGKLLEDRTLELFENFFEPEFKVYRGYYVEGCEQDILFLWKKYAFIIETKGYGLREPLRTPEKAFTRIKSDFNASIGYGYVQTRRVEEKFINGEVLKITDKDGKLIDEIDTTDYEQDFSIIVNLKSFGQIQCDLATLITLENDDDIHPWAVKLDDLEIFLLTMKAQKKTPEDFVSFLLMREVLHDKLICSDELEICGAFIDGKLNQKQVEKAKLVITEPNMGNVFDNQYTKTMGFKNEKRLYEKQSGKYLFW